MQEQAEVIRDYMIPFSDYPKVNHNVTLEEAVNMMHSTAKTKGYRWIVVMNDDKKIAGFLTLRSVFEAFSNLAPKAGGWLGVFNYARPGLFYWEGVQLIKDTPLKKCIRPLVEVHVHENDPPAKAAEIIIKRRITIVPVVDDQNEVIGIVRPVDLLPFIKRLFDNAPAQ
ncbi:MAG TPA: CBS domain-containing protein [Desulfotomaculum sp.]|nr:MAG: hypothetical protein VR67_02425 [Peptococcaceae bacterium BRH_c8a]KJS76022.1 MAG: hypothetical protein JL56_06315 [Desulfotomaculum sp. BICA1-6]HBX24633.1 CBS domain-containing protein [Desulfotomaculum sp.]